MTNIASYHLTDQDAVRWYIAVVGEQPNPAVEEALLQSLARGELTRLPEKFAALITRHYRRAEQHRMSFEEWLEATDHEKGRG